MATLPRNIIDKIYRAVCCVPTPELAQKEPCACAAAYLVEQIEEWAESLAPEIDPTTRIDGGRGK